MALIYNATFAKTTRKLSFEDRAGNEIYSFIVPEREKDDLTKPLTFRATQDNSKVTLTRNGYPSGSFQTSRDGGSTWVDYTIGTAITLNIGDEVSFRAKTDRTEHERYNYFYFKMTGKIEAWHNVMSMLRTNDFATYESVVNYSLSGMFYGCTSLKKAPALPATTLAQYCYSRMFYGCTSLTKAPELPATTLAPYCYESMFEGCTSLKKAPALHATTLANDCCYRMFYSCRSLTKAPALPATTLAMSCYESMFEVCTSLTEVPDLPATTLANSCCYRMFYGCRSLTKAPELPATTLVDTCYKSMFQGCTSLTKSPVLPATTFATTYAANCYESMFSGCSNLNEVRCQMPSSYSSDTISSLAYKWLDGVSSTGTFYTNSYANWPSGVSGIPENWTRFSEKDPAVDDIAKPLKFMTTQDGSTVTLTKYGSPTGDFQTSRDGGSTWVDYTIGTAITLNIGDEVAFRAKEERTSAQTQWNYFYFKMTGKIEAWHNVASLYCTRDFATYDSVMMYLFYLTFKDCTSLTKAPVLPATIVATYSFYYMFRGCTSLKKAPALPATKLAQYCYNSMFYGCTSLTEAPELPATTLVDRCYESMFEGCTSLTEAPELPATTFDFGCYSRMFAGCKSLTKAPALPATTLADRCYDSMFSGCKSLTKAPALPATKLTSECYQFMFSGCTSLTEAPALPATALDRSCYWSMFYGCKSLTKAPALPATRLASECYKSMFQGCTSLTKAPELPTYSFGFSYESMFKGCSSLNEVHCRASSSYSSSQISSYAKDWLSGVASTGTFYTNADAKWPSGASGIPQNWSRVNV